MKGRDLSERAKRSRRHKVDGWSVLIRGGENEWRGEEMQESKEEDWDRTGTGTG